ncbi:MAG: ParB/RepB/Spo0J family partition protein [Nevskiaceae bacterium]|nr:MAG: ParB/RepB/Spo0J family partition protein [Nevskiaceae bacterium]TBR72563.1 MAG: ParB/RepB/Spo0J family partition protein [Nevskiaceae bacterium]
MTPTLPNDPAEVVQVPVDLIAPGRLQARRHFDAGRLAELAESIRESGVVQPVVLRHTAGGRFELLAGERRWRAAQLAGVHELPAIVRDDLDDDAARVLGLVENLQRESLSPLETAAGLRQLAQHYALTHEEVGRRIGKSRAYVTNFLRLLELDPAVRDWVNAGRLTLGHAKVLCGLDAAAQRHFGAAVLAANLSVRTLERRVAAAVAPQPAAAPRNGNLARLERSLADQLGYAVHVEADAHGVGRVTLRFDSLDELDGLLARLGYDPDA